MPRRTVTDLVELVLDRDSFVSWDDPVLERPGLTEPHRAELAAARAASGRDEAILTGQGRLNGRRVALVAGDPAFLGGSIGVNAAERLTAGIERATAERLPLIALPIGGGTRMQEGTLAFLQMVKITGAVTAHKAEHLPYLVYLRDSTMGGVFASWGSLGHVSIAEPGAMIGFLGPRVYEVLYGHPFPAGVQLSENLHEHGIIDAVAPPEELAGLLDRVLSVLTAGRGGAAESPGRGPDPVEPASARDTSAWDVIEQTRRADRPGVRDLLAAATDVTTLNGTGDGESHPGSVLALARFEGTSCVVLGQGRQGQALERPLDAAALREARRAMRLSRELDLPLVTVIDTPGAALSKEAEERGTAGEIARSLSDFLTLPTPTASLLLGQGSGGVALALVPADRVLACERAWLAPLPPEGASAIVHRDVDRAAEMAVAQGVRAPDLLANGIVDRVIAEPDDPAADRAAWCRAVAGVLAAELRGVLAPGRDERLAARRRRYRALGCRT